MLTVRTPEEVLHILETAFSPRPKPEEIPLAEARGRVLFAPITAEEFVPGFDRSTVDGYAVRSEDTFGCSDALPAILTLQGEVLMGEGADQALGPGCCAAVPTGGAMPIGSDAAVMLEYTEDYGDGTIGICKSAAPGANLIFKGDDVRPGQTVLPAGRRLTAQDIGALAALGTSRVAVSQRPAVGIISTGDELVPVDETPGEGQVRDVNSAMLQALAEEAGAQAVCFGILKDDEALLRETLDHALRQCDMVLISGGSSVGMKDATCRVIEDRGELLFHGIAMKPGKPTILGSAGGKPVFGLPGHPVAAYFVSRLFVRPLLDQLQGCASRRYAVPAVLTEAVSANHGRAQYMGVFLSERNGVWYASPIRGKSGLITTLANSDGYFCIPRDCEGVAAGETIDVLI
ncbi:MAG: molybdopterin molybdotransferase MoeA [Oscillospiraceae bacterium]|nr:molybdopterin molybdotransferase MoeA [Oscillospiraceae bacterium]